MVYVVQQLELVTLQVLYYRPDYTALLQEFMWQCEDRIPDLPRVHRFLLYWKDNINATIHSVEVAHTDPSGKTRYMRGKDYRLV